MKKKLLILEGPTGTGKTTIRKELFKNLTIKNIELIPEFSTTDIGDLLFRYSSITKKPPQSLTGISGALIYLADKLYFIKDAIRNSESEIVIFDRFIMSQIILGMHFIEDPKEAYALERLILEVNRWLLDIFSDRSTIYLFEAPYEILVDRIQKKTDSSLDTRARDYLKKTHEAYKNYNWAKLGWRVVNVNSSRSINDTVNFIQSDIRRVLLDG